MLGEKSQTLIKGDVETYYATFRTLNNKLLLLNISIRNPSSNPKKTIRTPPTNPDSPLICTVYNIIYIYQ